MGKRASLKGNNKGAASAQVKKAKVELEDGNDDHHGSAAASTSVPSPMPMEIALGRIKPRTLSVCMNASQ